MNDRSNEALLDRLAKAEAATPGPYACYADVKAIFGVEPYDWGMVYAKVRPDMPPWAIMSMNLNMIPPEEEERARKAFLAGIGNDPGQPGRNAAHVAANSPDVTIADIDEILRLRSLIKEHEEYIANLELEAQAYDKKISEIAAILGIEHTPGYMYTVGIIKDEILRLRAENARLDREADWLADQMHKTLVIDGKHKSKCVFGKDEWREVARKATENPAQEVRQDAKQMPKWAWAKG